MNIKKGINESAFLESLSYKEIFEITKKTNFDGLELNFFYENGRLNIKSAKDLVKEINELKERYKIEIPSILCTETYRLFTTTSYKNKEKLFQLVKNGFDIAKNLNSKCILICEGWINEDISYIEGYKNALSFFKEISKIAEEYEIYIGIENVRNKFLLTPLSFLNFIEEIGSKYVKIYFDTGNVIGYGYPDDWIKILKKYIFQIHLKDFKEKENIFVPILDGDVNWLNFRKVLEELDYNGYIIVEKSPHNYFPLEDIYLNSIKVDIILGRFEK